MKTAIAAAALGVTLLAGCSSEPTMQSQEVTTEVQPSPGASYLASQGWTAEEVAMGSELAAQVISLSEQAHGLCNTQALLLERLSDQDAATIWVAASLDDGLLMEEALGVAQEAGACS